MFVRIGLGLVWLLLAVIVFCLILFRKWVKKKGSPSASVHHYKHLRDSAVDEASEAGQKRHWPRESD